MNCKGSQRGCFRVFDMCSGFGPQRITAPCQEAQWFREESLLSLHVCKPQNEEPKVERFLLKRIKEISVTNT